MEILKMPNGNIIIDNEKQLSPNATVRKVPNSTQGLIINDPVYGAIKFKHSDVTAPVTANRDALFTELVSNFFFRLTVTPEGGYAVPLINKTGAASIKGTIVTASSVDSAFDINPANIPKPFGVVYESGKADGDVCYVVVSGIAEVLLEDGTASIAGYWSKVSDNIAGRADMSNEFPPGGTIAALEDHLSEIGHCIESKNAGVNVLAKCIIHFL